MLVSAGGALRMAMAALSRASNLITDHSLTNMNRGLVACYELDLAKRTVNMSLFNNITGTTM
jgi:hypothetical protein